ncbi:hypothetical protein LIER_24218 [Lithospermum erythrorhizon]|uniref:F-box domain-containing protein n=1 Tax=Lithospermum erythrorhizon TaxID=34254 RepID=A0AAV3R2I9_LITER
MVFSAVVFQKRKRVRDFDYFIQEHTCPKENYITRLPDEILCHIISYLGMKDAVRTCVLSRRWRILYCTLPNPKFECHKMFEFVSLIEHNFHRTRFVTAVDTFLRLRSGLPMESFTLRFDLMREFTGHLRS